MNDALYLFLEHPDLGFVWMAYDEQEWRQSASICLRRFTSMGALVANFDDVSVKAARRGQGHWHGPDRITKGAAEKRSVMRIDVSVHLETREARAFTNGLEFQLALNGSAWRA